MASSEPPPYGGAVIRTPPPALVADVVGSVVNRTEPRHVERTVVVVVVRLDGESATHAARLARDLPAA